MNILEIAVNDLQPGMFVSRLDRPWLETPYLLQGIHIQSQEDINQLKRYCKSVFVDVDECETTAAKILKQKATTVQVKKIPDQAASKEKNSNPRLQKQQEQLKKRIFSDSPDLQQIFESKPSKTPFHGNKIYTDTRTSTDEIPAATNAITNVTALLDEINSKITSNTKIDFASAQETICSLRDSVIRNPDATLLLARLKTTGKKLYDYAIKISINLLALGRQLGLPPQELSLLGLGGLLMDIGKMSLPEEIQTKDSFLLKPSERKLMQQHIAYGESIISQSNDYPDAIHKIISQHHERENGLGYPSGLNSENIHAYARMAAIVDCYEEYILTGASSLATKPFHALKELKNNAQQGGLNSALIEQFIHSTGIFPVGTLVELNTKEVAIVLTHNRSQRLLPKVMIILNANKKPYDEPITIDLRTTEPGPNGNPYAISTDLPLGAYNIDTNKYYL